MMKGHAKEKRELENKLKGEMQEAVDGLLREARTQREKAVDQAEKRLASAIEACREAERGEAAEQVEQEREAGAALLEEQKEDAARRLEQALREASEAREVNGL